MSSNAAIAGALESLARLMELLGEDRFKVIAHQRAARSIEGCARGVAGLTTDRAALRAIEGIGEKIADKVIEFVNSGRIAELEALRARVPAGLLSLMEIPGLGPKTVRMLWIDAGVEDLAGLKRIIADGSILSLPRMGAKSVEKLRESIAFVEAGASRLPLGRAAALSDEVIGRLRGLVSERGESLVERVVAAGSLRRGRDSVGDLDILVSTSEPAAVVDAFVALPGVETVLARGDTRASVRVRLGSGRGRGEEGFASEEGVGPVGAGPGGGGPVVQVDLRVVPAASWGAALLYFTGSKAFNVRLRERALKRGLTLNEYGLYPESGDPTPPHDRGATAVAGASEEEIFLALGLPYLPPEVREDRGELSLTASPRLVEAADIRAELHAHTRASDGEMEIQELAERARARGFHTLAVTDHSKSSAVAGGLSEERLMRHVEAVRRVGGKLKGITLLAGSEVDILADGTLDYADEVLAALDVVVASPHAALSQDPDTATARLLKAIRHPRVHILGHPTGRLVNRRAGLSPDMPRLFAAAAERGVALEINAHWMRLDLRDIHARGAIDAGCLIAIDCDVHAPDDFDNLRFGVVTARRGWVTPERCVNTWTAAALHDWLTRRRG
ncbi:MAG: PHP domain-containing protein [Phycisphaerae bacterium]|nr:PHP domain-containing protein [Phycisphaerae bacterium]